MHKIISARQRLWCLRSVLNTLLGPRERDVRSQLNAIAATKKLRREQVKRFFMNYRPAQVSGVPNNQVAQTSSYFEKIREGDSLQQHLEWAMWVPFCSDRFLNLTEKQLISSFSSILINFEQFFFPQTVWPH